MKGGREGGREEGREGGRKEGMNPIPSRFFLKPKLVNSLVGVGMMMS